MEPYRHIVQYYETDKMGITHHSNYIRWMEEARVDFLKKAGWGFSRMESTGISSPVVSLNCKYRFPTKFEDVITIYASVKSINGVKMTIGYVMKNEEDRTVFEGESVHAFFNGSGKPLLLRRDLPDFCNALTDSAE